MGGMMRGLALAALAAIASCGNAAWASAGRLGGGGSVDLSLLRIALSLVLCLLIAVFAILLLKRNGGRLDRASMRKFLSGVSSGDRRIEVIEVRRISAHADLCLVRCDEVEYVVLCSAQQQQLLREQMVAGKTDA